MTDAEVKRGEELLRRIVGYTKLCDVPDGYDRIMMCEGEDYAILTGLTMPPMKVFPDGSTEVIRLT